jgi:hypothetical protein
VGGEGSGPISAKGAPGKCARLGSYSNKFPRVCPSSRQECKMSDTQERERERERELSRRILSVLGIDPPAGSAAFEFRNPGRRLTIISEGVFSKSTTGSPVTVARHCRRYITAPRNLGDGGRGGETGAGLG